MGKFTSKKIIIALVICLVAFTAILLTIYELSKERQNLERPNYSFDFHEMDMETDILKDESYLSLNRRISLKQGNMINTIDENYISDNGTVEFMIDYLNCVIAGDHEKYKNFFSDLFFENESVPNYFTMQRIYEITIELISETAVSESNKIYTEYRISLDYKINRNDGSFRNDMGSDCIRTQYFLLTNREGDLKIDTIKSFDIVNEIPSDSALELKISDIAAVTAVLGILIALTVIIIKKRKKT